MKLANLGWASEVNGLNKNDLSKVPNLNESREVDLDSVACSPKLHVLCHDLGCREVDFCLKTESPIRRGQIMGPGPKRDLAHELSNTAVVCFSEVFAAAQTK